MQHKIICNPRRYFNYVSPMGECGTQGQNIKAVKHQGSEGQACHSRLILQNAVMGSAAPIPLY